MVHSDNITLQRYVDTARQKLDDSENSLTQVEGSFQLKTNGKTKSSIIGSMVGTICWFVALCVFFWLLRNHTMGAVYPICIIISFALVATMLWDEYVNYVYFGRIFSYIDNITQLKNRVIMGRSSITSSLESFLRSRSVGWDQPLSIGPSIPEEAMSIEKTINGMETLKGGFLNGLKTVLYYSFAVAITGIGSWALFGTACSFVNALFDSYPPLALFVIALVIVEIGEVILAKMFWSKTDCNVTNITLLIAPAGPILFMLLVVTVTLIIGLVVIIFQIFAAIFVVCMAGAIAFGATSGG